MSNHLFDALFAPHAGSARRFLDLPGGGSLDFAGFVDLSGRLARALADRGVRPGDRVAAQVPKSPTALALYAACVRAGAVFLPLNTAYTAAEVGFFLADAGARLFICAPGTEVPEGLACLTLDADGQGSLTEAAAGLAAGFPAVPAGPDDLAAILYTSGTTGRSKGAMLSHGNLLSNARALTDLWRFTGEDVLLHALPIFHTHGLFVATHVCLLAGAAMILHPAFNAGAVLADLPRATAMMGVPTFYTRLLAEPALTRDLVGHMRLFVSGSAPLLAETHRAWEARTGHRILERYGMTETGMNTSNPFDGDRRAGTVGLPLPGVEVRITDPATGSPLPQGEPGMIEVRGPNVFRGYWNLPEKTAEELRADGFFVTGDIGAVDADGYLSIVGRQKDLIISGGFNIYPKEIELVLDALPGVAESAVIGVPHPDLGEGVLAVVTGDGSAVLDPAALLAALDGRLARFKQPRSLVVLDALPRNAMGKVRKADLRATFRGALTGA
jgi:malonyl-CoA/methylmalonyl-CoA synthetase